MAGKLGHTSRYRIEYRAGKWYCVLYGTGNPQGGEKPPELGISPGGNEHDAEGYMENHRRYGAWLRS